MYSMVKTYFKPQLDRNIMKKFEQLRQLKEEFKYMSDPKLIEFCVNYTLENIKKKN